MVEKLEFVEGNPDLPIPRSCSVFHAKGGEHADNEGRVRFENAARIYAPYFDEEGYDQNKWVWTFLKFTR